MKKFCLSLAALAVVVSGIALFGFLNTNSQAAEPREDCNAGSDYNSIIKCGTLSASELAKKYRENPKGDLDNIYKHYGLSANEVTHANGSTGKMGRVYKDGKVKVDGKVVAINAKSLGRHDKPGSTKVTIAGKTYYERKNTSAFVVDSISAFVFFDKNGEFKAAILTACGNPVRADKPIYKCEDLTKKAVSRNRFEFTAKAIAKDGAQVSSYTFDFGDGNSKKTTNKSVAHTFKPGKYTVKVTVKFKVNGYYEEKTGSQCKVAVEVAEPTYACKNLTFSKISRNEYKFTAKAEASNGAKVVSYKYDFGDGKTKDNANAAETHKYSKPGKYTVQVWANIKIDGKYNREATSQYCKVQVTVAPEADYSCDSLEKKMITRTKYEFTGKATAANGPTITDYTIDFGDSTSAQVADPTNVPHEYAEPGTYTVKMTANMVINGQATPVTSENCEVEVTVVPPNKVEVCNPETGETIVVDEGDADNYVPVGDPACEPVQVCNPETGETITVDKKDEDKYKPVGDAACEEKPEECVPDPKGNNTCEELPAELPTTGPAETIGGIVGLGSLVAAGYYWYASRRGLMSEMLNR